MSAVAPSAIYALWNAIKAKQPRAQLGGIVGDTAHSFGYHLARRDLPASDYSVSLPADKLGSSANASALDVSLPADLMKRYTANLLAAAKAGDHRLRALREFCGTLNGTDTYPYDLSSHSGEGINSWDDSHLWHIHLSFYREFADNEAALLPIADVMLGIPLDQDKAEEMALSPQAEAQLRAILTDFLHGKDGKAYGIESLEREALSDVITKVNKIAEDVAAIKAALAKAS